MAEFCHDCSLAIFGEDYGDFAGLATKTPTVDVLCEECGFIAVDIKGRKVDAPQVPHATPVQ